MGLKTRIVKTPCGDVYVEEYWEDEEEEEFVIGNDDNPIPVEIPVSIPENA